VSGSPYADLDRPPLRAAALRRALAVPGGLWTEVVVTPQTASTNADVAGAARDGGAEGLVVVAERQTAGRGRLGRQWESPPRAGIAVSVLLRPDVPVNRYGWLPLLAGVALVETVRRLGAVDAVLKWPNDLLIDERKCAGILAEAVPESVPAIVLGIGLNVTLREAELPRPDATSLALAGSSCVDRDPLLRALLRSLAGWYRRWRAEGGDADRCGLRETYRLHCATLGRPVRVTLPGGTVLAGTGSDVDDTGRLVVTGADGGTTTVAAGDVLHVR
jgi:BirA family biotin operon repressor/biotin-[acetyl-CoA-carboxylase] ligase